jgi:ATP-dependent DNA helicase RecQ
MGGRYPSAADIRAVREALQQLDAGARPATLSQIQAAALSVGRTRQRSVLSVMKELGIVRELRGARFRLEASSIDAARIDDVAAQYAERQEADKEKLQRMAAYGQSALCRWKLLLDYFGEADGFDRCGTCDNCLEPPELRYAPPVDRDRVDLPAPGK